MNIQEKYERAKIAYETGAPTMTDAEFDALEARFENAGGIVEVGAKSAANTVPHISPMLSIEKAKTIDALLRWAKKRNGKGEPQAVIVTPKLDGMAVELRYVDGRLVQAVTRGKDGRGQDVTEKVSRTRVSKTLGRLSVRIRGELVMSRSSFDHLVASGADYSNPRNAVAGLINADYSPGIMLERIDFVGYEILRDDASETPRDFINDLISLDSWGFGGLVSWARSVAATEEKLLPFTSTPPDIMYPCDGLVFRVDNHVEAAAAGSTSHHFKHSIAYKFADAKIKTIVAEVTWQVGTSTITPIVHFAPIDVDGVTLTQASAKSAQNLLAIGGAVGGAVLVSRSGGVIPRVEAVATPTEATAATVTRSVPRCCPACGAHTLIDGAHLVCSRPFSCRGVRAKKLELFAKSIGIKIVGPVLAEELVEAGYDTPMMLLSISETANQWPPRVVRAVKATRKAKHDPVTVLAGLCIPGLGRSGAAGLVAEKGGTLSGAALATEEELSAMGYDSRAVGALQMQLITAAQVAKELGGI